MICQNCNTEIPDISKFCPQCGSRIELPSEPDIIEETSPYHEDDRIYATCHKVDEKNNCVFYLEDGSNSFFVLPGQYLEKMNLPVKKGISTWARILDPGKGRRIKKVRIESPSDKPEKGHVIRDFLWFYERHSIEDILHAPIVKACENYVDVSLTANVTSRIYKTEFPDPVLFDDFKVGNIEKFIIKQLEKNESGKIVIQLSPCTRYVNKNKLWDLIPETLENENVIIGKRILDYLDDGVLENLLGSRSVRNPQDLIAPISRIYANRYNEKEVYVEKRGDILNMNFALEFLNNNGVPEEVYMKREPGEPWVITSIMPTRAERLMDRYVHIPDMKSMLDELDDLCLTGDAWDYGNNSDGQKKILKNYLYFSFYKAWLDKLIVENESGAIFNTGLVDNAYDDIYCYFEPNAETDFMQRKWRFCYFACRGKDRNGKELNRIFPSFPKAPSYIDNDHISDLYFNADKELYCDYDHIIDDNVERLPYEFLRTRLNYDSRINPLIEEYEQTPKDRPKILKRIYDTIREKGIDGERLRRELQEGLKSAVETSKKYCKWNYKTAIPVYYAKTNSISLLLPLKLRQDKNVHADIALVVERLPNGNYQGQTIFTLDMAYQDARQICRPNSDWLMPQEIKQDS